MSQDHTDIINRLKARDQEALRELYRLYGGALNGIVTRMIQRNDIAEEVLQDCFIRIWDKIDLFDPAKGRLFTWMAQLTRNVCRDRLKSKANQESQKTESIENLVFIENLSTDGSEHNEHDRINSDNLQQLLRKEEWQVIDYVYFRGYTQRDLSKKMDIPLGTIKTRIRMAVNNLREVLKQKESK